MVAQIIVDNTAISGRTRNLVVTSSVIAACMGDRTNLTKTLEVDATKKLTPENAKAHTSILLLTATNIQHAFGEMGLHVTPNSREAKGSESS
jgi:hypothetical protein